MNSPVSPRKRNPRDLIRDWAELWEFHFVPNLRDSVLPKPTGAVNGYGLR